MRAEIGGPQSPRTPCLKGSTLPLRNPVDIWAKLKGGPVLGVLCGAWVVRGMGLLAAG